MSCTWNPFASIDWRASLVPAPAVIPAPIACIKDAAVKKLVVGFLPRTTGPPSCLSALHMTHISCFFEFFHPDRGHFFFWGGSLFFHMSMAEFFGVASWRSSARRIKDAYVRFFSLAPGTAHGCDPRTGAKFSPGVRFA